MAKKVFISFRFSDGADIKERIVSKLTSLNIIINKSESVNRSSMTEDTIKRYLYEKLADSSITIVLLTPKAINYEKNIISKLDDWLYDELRYSLEDRVNNITNGVIAVYTKEAKASLIVENGDSVSINDFNNLVRKNMFNIKSQYKHNPNINLYDRDYDHYISLVSLEDFMSDPQKYIDIATKKRKEVYKYNLVKSMDRIFS